MKTQSLLDKMLVLATQRHSGQTDRGGKPYILHPLKVMYYLKADNDEELMCIGLGHDLVEDTPTTYEELRQMGFTERIIKGIQALTKVPGETNQEYLTRIMANRDAVLVKLQDLRHNSDIRRLKGVTEKDAKRLDKYAKMYTQLTDYLKEIK